MQALGIKEARDIDIVVMPELFEKCKQSGWEQVHWTYPEKLGQIYLRKGSVELYLDVNCGSCNPTTEELIQNAHISDGVPFISLDQLISFKRAYGKEKDFADTKLVEEYQKTD